MAPPRRKKNKKKSNETQHTTTTAEDQSASTSRMSETQFSRFIPATTSSPALNPFQPLIDRKESIVRELREEARIAKDSIARWFNSNYQDNMKKCNINGVYKGPDIVECVRNLAEEGKNKTRTISTASKGDSGLHRTGSAIEVTSTRKVTWDSKVNSEMPPPRLGVTTTIKNSRRSRTMSPPGAGHTLNHTVRRSMSASRPEFKTPCNSNTFNYNIATVTPHPLGNRKVNSTILRKPKLGETAISMCGSPLIVSSDNITAPSVIVPLSDGRVFNVQGAAPGSSPFKHQLREGLDAETMQKLRELKDFLDELVPQHV